MERYASPEHRELPYPVCTWQALEMFRLDLTCLGVMRLQVKPQPLG
jgi:hypothetical protein